MSSSLIHFCACKGCAKSKINQYFIRVASAALFGNLPRSVLLGPNFPPCHAAAARSSCFSSPSQRIFYQRSTMLEILKLPRCGAGLKPKQAVSGQDTLPYHFRSTVAHRWCVARLSVHRCGAPKTYLKAVTKFISKPSIQYGDVL